MDLKKTILPVILLALSCFGSSDGNGLDREWEIYLIHHTHVDIGFTHTQDEVMQKQWRNLESAMDLIDQTDEMPDDAKFRWNPETTWAIETWLEQASPEQKARFVRQVKQGRISLDALFGNMLTGLSRPEELMQSLSYKYNLEDLTGVKINSAMITDVPGWSWGIVTALAENRVKYFSIGPNRTHRIGHTLKDWGDKPFYWTSPSGRHKVLCFVHGKGYSWFHTPATLTTELKLKNKFTEKRIIPYLKNLEQSGYPYDIIPIRYAIGRDNGPPDPNISQIVQEWNQKHPRIKVRLSSAAEALARLEQKYGEQIPSYSGDFTPYWSDGAASTARETAIARNAAEKLDQAQTLFALTRGAKTPIDQFHQAWNQVLLFNEHTWGAYNSITKPGGQFAKSQWEWKKQRALNSETMADELLDQALYADQKPRGITERDAVYVVNSHSWPISGPVEIETDLTGKVRVETPDGRPIPAQILSNGRLLFIAQDIPGFSSAKYTIKQGSAAEAPGCSVSENSISNETLKILLDKNDGTIASIKNLKTKAEYVNQNYRDKFNQYVYIRGRIPQIGKTITLNPKPEFTVTERGPVACSIEVTGKVKKSHSLRTTITLYQGLDRVDIVNELDRPSVRMPEGVHFAFPVQAENPSVRYDVAWGSVEVDVDQIKGACKNYFTPLRWVDVSGDKQGIQIVLQDAPLFEAGAITTDAVLYGWKRETKHNGVVYSYVMNNYWETNYKAYQPGITTFRYSLFPHGRYDGTVNAKQSLEVMQPLLTTMTSPRTGPLVLIDNQNIIIESIKPSRSSDGLELTLFNISDLDQEALIAGTGTCESLYLIEDGSRSSEQVTNLCFGKHDMFRVYCNTSE